MKLMFTGIMIAEVVSNKADRKERAMEDERNCKTAGRFLTRGSPTFRRPGRFSRWLTVTVLLAWDGLLLYMIVECLIEPVYGAAFVAVVSIYLGYQL